MVVATRGSAGKAGVNSKKYFEFSPAIETEKDITLFLDEQIRRYDKNLKEVFPDIEIYRLKAYLPEIYKSSKLNKK